MRRISTGRVGDTLLGSLAVDDTVLSPLATGDSLSLSGSTVSVDVDFDVTGGNSLRIYNGSNYVDLNAPAISTNVNFTLPANTGTTGDVLRSDGSGNLSFVDVAFDVNNQTADTATYYPLMSTSSSGEITGVSTSTSKLSFQPSSGTLTASIISGSLQGSLSSSNVDINGGNIDGTTIGSSTAANGTFNSLSADLITETSARILKDDIQPISNAAKLIGELNGVNYTRLSSNVKEAGFIAEEVENVIPELVDNSKDYKSISYSRLTAYIVEAIKEIKKEVEILKNG